MYTIGGLPMADRLAGSDIAVPAGKTQKVPIEVTKLGAEAAAASPLGYQGPIYIALRSYGWLPDTSLVIRVARTPT